MGMNSVCVMGNLTRDPDLRTGTSGGSVCIIRIAVNTREKVGETWSDKANYFDVVVFGAQGENAAKHLEKGRGINVTGRLDWREYKDKEGNKREAVRIIAHDVQFLPSGQKREDSPGAGEGQPDADEFGF